jgi:predicted NBD/HSP70 family sugar kinase
MGDIFISLNLFYGELIHLSTAEDSMATGRIRKAMADIEAGTVAAQIVGVLSRNGGMSAAQIARLTGLARSTVSTAVTQLKLSHVVVEVERMTLEGAGRPGILLALNPQAGTCVGVHLGYDEVQIVAADISHNFIAQKRFAMGVDYGPDQAMATVKSAFEEFYKANGLSRQSLMGAGISVSGPVSRIGVLQRGGILPRWAGLNINALFSSVFNAPVMVENESNCAALAELKWGAARGTTDFVMFKMDVGVGGAIVNNGRVITGVSGGAGEFGHVSINPEGELCRCGNRGCLELYASFVKPIEQLSRVHRKDMTIESAIALAEAGDAGAMRLIADVAEYGGRGLAMVGTIINPPLFLIGGRLAQAGELLLAPMRKSFERHSLIKPQDDPHTTISIGKFTENDSLLGAVALVLDNHHALISS